MVVLKNTAHYERYVSAIFDNEGNHPQRVEIHVGTSQLSIDSNKLLKRPSYKEKQIHPGVSF